MSEVPGQDRETVDASGPRPESGSRNDTARAPSAVWRFLRGEPLGAVSLLLIVVFVLSALAAPVIVPFDPVVQHRQNVMEPPSGQFLMGTDDLGRDVLSRVLYGARVSLLVGVVTVAICLVVGGAIGIVSGYLGKAADMVLQRIMDAILSVPTVVLLLFIAALLGPSVRNVILSLSIVIIPQFNRVARAEMLRIREEGYVEAARATGSSAVRIMVRHGLPNMMGPLMTIASLTFAIVIIAEASLSFLGIGTPPPTPAWGRMLSDATRSLQTGPWMVVFPGLALSFAVLAFNLLGDSLRNFFDPKHTR